jgi:hypothetical protein
VFHGVFNEHIVPESLTERSGMSISFNNGTIVTLPACCGTMSKCQAHTDELFELAEEHDGLLISEEARAAGI